MTASDPGESEIAEALGEWLALETSSRADSIEVFCRARPHLAGVLRSCLDLLAAGAPLEAGMPRRLGEFRIEGLIGQGGMGCVYSAMQSSLGRRVALKVLPRLFALDAERAQRFKLEVEATARLRHPNIVPVYAAGEVDGIAYYAMPLLEGRSCDRVIDELRARGERSLLSGRLVLVQWVQRFIDVARGLDHAHAQCVVHRDVKPSNLFLEDDGRLLLLDFGLTRSLQNPGITGSGVSVGSPRYMSPEQLLGRSDAVGARTDVYSLAATIYELLLLRPVHEGDDRASIFHAILDVDPVAPRRIDERVPRDLELILLRALEKEPGRRYASAAALADDLQRFLDYAPVRARPVGFLGRTWRRAQRNPFASLAVVVGLLASTAAWAANIAERAASRRSDARRARSELEAGRAAGVEMVRVRARIAELDELVEARSAALRPWFSPWKKGDLLDLEQERVDLVGGRDRILREGLAHLHSAQQLAPGDDTPRRAIARLALDEFLHAESARDAGRMESMRPLIEGYDDGSLAEYWESEGSLVIECEPPGARAWLFRFVERDLRLIPVPCSATGAIDESYLDRVATRGPWRRLRVTSVERGVELLQVGDEITSVCGAPPRDAQSLSQHLAAAHPYVSGGTHYLELRRAGQYEFLSLGPQQDVTCEAECVVVDPCPLACEDARSLGAAPLELPRVSMGSYLLVLRAGAAAPLRVPFELRRREREQVSVSLDDAALGGPDYVYVPGGPAWVGADAGALDPERFSEVDVAPFWILRHEVTFGEYFEFLADLELEAPGEARRRAPRDPPARPPLDRSWKESADGRIEPALQPGLVLDTAVVGISWEDARAYCAWIGQRHLDAGLEADLPTEREYEKASRGADGRSFPWGDSLDWTFARLGWSAEYTSLLPAGLYPTDVSVYGVHDLAGNVREWCSGSESEPWRVLRGGSWGTRIEEDCHVASRASKRDPRFCDTSSGFRVVLRRR